MVRCYYITYAGSKIALVQPDFGLYVITYNDSVVKEFHCKDKAKVYYSRAIEVIKHKECRRAV